MKIFVLGSDGMLGNYVYNYLDKTKFVGKVIRCPHVKTETVIGIDALWDKELIYSRILFDYKIKPGDIIINCIGIINKKVDSIGIKDTIQINSIFPHILQELSDIRECKLIHISTNCVFSGTKGNYSEDSLPDATDIYGKTKYLGEPPKSTIIRTSIIGEEKYNKYSLLEWVKSNRNKTIDGYIKHIWNGITCLRLAQYIGEIIDKGNYWQGVKHIYGNRVSKYELLWMINIAYHLGIAVVAKDTEPCDKTLKSIKQDIIFDMPDLFNDIIAQKEFGL